MSKFTVFSKKNPQPELTAEQDAEEIVANQLRCLREEKGYSLRALAARSGLNVNTLSLIERGKSSPSVGTLQQLARALDVPTSAFFESRAADSAVVFTQAGYCPSTRVGENTLHNLGAGLNGNAVQPFIVNLKSGAGSGKHPSVHTGHEFVYCLRGLLSCWIEEESFSLSSGDSLLFEAHLPHRWQNETAEETQILLIFCPADAREAPGASHFDINELL